MALGQKIFELAKGKNISLKQLARELDIPYTTLYSLVRRDSNKADYELIQKVTEYFGVTSDYLLGTEKPKDNGPAPTKRVSDEDIMFALFGGADEITEEDFDEVRRFAAFIAERKKRDSQN